MRFSLIVPVRTSPLPMLGTTLDSAKSQKEVELEIIVVAYRLNQQMRDLIDRYENVQLIESEDQRLDAMLKQGIDAAMCDYVHILRPGELYLSFYALQIMTEYIAESDHPDVVVCGTMAKGEAYFNQISYQNLRKGWHPLSGQNFWFKKALLDEYDGGYKYLGFFDFLCRTVEAKKRISYFRRVLTDSYRFKTRWTNGLEEGQEMLRILTHYFGPGAALKWWLTVNQKDFFTSIGQRFKKAFLP